MRRFSLVLISFAILALAPGCATSQKSRTSGGPIPGDRSHLLKGQELTDYRELQALFNRGSYEALLPKAASYERRYPRGAQISHVYNFHGLAYLLTRRPNEAATYFRKSVETAPHPIFRDYVLYNLAAAQFESGLLDEATITLTQIKLENFDRATQVKFYTLRGRIALKQGRSQEAARDTLMAARGADRASAAQAYGPQLEQSIQSINEVSTLADLYSEFDETPLIDLVLFRLASIELALGKVGAGESHLRRLINRYPESSKLAEAKQLLDSSVNQNVVDPQAVGVLLPLHGRFEKFGRKALQAIELAFRVFNANEPDSKITLVVRDSGDDAESAIKGLNDLYFKDHVIGVIGPLLSKGIEAVTQRAQEMGLPLLTLAQQQGVSGDYVFTAGITPRVQAEEIARYAVEHLRMKRFAIVHPRDKFGEQFSQAYWDAVTALGGKVVGVESYPSGETDFRQMIDRLTGRFYPEARQRELDELAKLREENQITKKNRKTEQYYELKPIIDFDAVFIPDEPKVVSQLLPTFSYRDIDGVKFLGTSTWNSPELLGRVQNYAEGAIIVDAFYAKSGNRNVQEFVARYQATFEEEPSLIEANAYDAASVMEAVLADGRVQSRQDLRAKLMSVSQFPGVTGKLTYKDGSFARNLTVLTIKNGQFVPAL